MDSRKVIFLLDLINKETKGHTEELSELYTRALDEDDSVKQLKYFLNDYVYYRERGHLLYSNGTSLINSLYTMPTKALEMFPLIKQACESIDNEMRACNELINSPMPFSDPITVLKKKDTMAYINALKAIANSCVYLIVLYSGLTPTKKLSWDDTSGLQEMVYAINTKFIPALLSVKRPTYTWMIRKKKMGGKALLGSDSFCLSYENSRNVELMTSNLHKEPMGTHSFLNIDAYETGECNVPFCWGVGNIVSSTPANALLYLENSVVTKLRSPDPIELKQKMPTPIECANKLSNGTLFCLTPDQLLSAMNQWQIGHDIEYRMRMHNCLFCGKYLTGNKLVCETHFTSEL